MLCKKVETKKYDKLVHAIDNVLETKRISYAGFSKAMGINSIAFYNHFKSYGFTLEDLEQFLQTAKKLPPKLIKCIKCNKEFTPKAKSVKRAFCSDCREEMRKKSRESDILRYNYPKWVTDIEDHAIRSLVEQEFHIDELTAYQMSQAATAEDAKAIRSTRWYRPMQHYSSVIYNTISVSKR
ncbi:MAG: hypothetical protein LBP51_06800 [Deferribacteraceae bacterium]|jgi:hypothetical protein|nr:hypothetical protein [Deferribacteraceae bacterium]